MDHKLTSEEYIEENPFGRLLSSDEISWIGSLISVGAMVGPFLAAYSSDRIGRKKTLLLCSGLPMLICYVTAAAAKHVFLYYISRFLSGFAIGAIYTVLPNYISEISEVDNRGAMSSTIVTFECAGMIFSYVLGPYLPILLYNIACAFVPALFIISFWCFTPESPHFLVAVGRQEEALESLTKLRALPQELVTKELEEIREDVSNAMERNASLVDIFKTPANRKAIIISLTLIGVQMITGINVILFYTQEIFETTGSVIPSEVSSIIIGIVQFAASFIAPVFVERLGRKSMFLISGLGVILSEVSLGAYFYFKDQGANVEALHWMPLLCLISFIITLNIGLGPLPWTVMAEICPSDIKSRVAMATAICCFLVAFLLTKFFHTVYSAIGMGGSFWLFAGFCFLGLVFVNFYLVETKGKKFSEIQELLATNCKKS